MTQYATKKNHQRTNNGLGLAQQEQRIMFTSLIICLGLDQHLKTRVPRGHVGGQVKTKEKKSEKKKKRKNSRKSVT